MTATATFIAMTSTSDFKRRAITEKVELNERLMKLGSFLNQERPTTISDNEWFRLMIQYNAMHQYFEILTERIERDFK